MALMEIAADRKWGHFYGGKDQPPASGQYFGSFDPASGDSLGDYAWGSAEDVDRACRDAHEGFLAWKKFQPHERGRVLMRFSQLMFEHGDVLVRLESLDAGKPLRTSRRDLDMSARYFEFYAGLADKHAGSTLPASNEHLVMTLKEPYGVTAHILPWNSPMNQFARGAAPALAMGNSVVIKPAELTPITTLYLARLAIEAGLPAGCVNVVTGYGDAGDAMARHPLSARITFTGSVATGRKVMHAAADRIVPVTTELGGKSPFIVFEDADLDKAATAAVTAFVANCGQTCSAGSRLLVQRSIRDAFVERMKRVITDTITVGPGVEDPTIGPVVSKVQHEKVLGYITLGQQEGARVAIGGGHPNGEKYEHGFFVEPTLLVDVRNDMRVAQEEIFGPVACVIDFEDEADAIAIANDTEFGLISGVWTRDLSRALRMASAIQAGQVYINNYREVDIHAPFGGYKNSGVGREKGLEALDHYTQIKTVAIRI